MTSIRKLLSALFLALCFSAYSNAQVSTSGELINNNGWSGATYGADPGGCCASISGSGPLYDTTTDTIMFSYGQATISQNIGLEAALGAQGIVLHGYNYSWDYRLVPNGNNFTSDNLIFNTRIRDASGNILFDRTSDYSGPVAVGINDAWQTQSGTVTFDPMQGASTLSLSITGRDGGFWAGYYGPELRNISMSANYTVDPCVNDPLYSTSCAGYWDAFVAAFGAFFGFGSSEPEPVIASVDYSLPTTVSISAMPEDSTTTEPVVDAGGIEVSTTGELAVPDGIPEVVKEDKKEKKAIDPSLLANILREATDDSKALSIVNQSIQDSMGEDANPDFSMTNETLQAIQSQTERSQQQAMQAQDALIQEQSNLSVETSQSQTAESDRMNEYLSEEISNDVSVVSIDVPIQIQQPIEVSTIQMMVEEEVVKEEVDTLAIIQDSLPKVTEENKQEKEVTVKQNVEPNEAASGSDIADIAISPIGFNDYLTKSLNDAQFYQDKEIYAGQTVVDNRRAQRLLNGASDRLHREMVDQQYRRQ